MSFIRIVTGNNLVQAVLIHEPLSRESMHLVRCIWPEMPERPALASTWGKWKVLCSEWYYPACALTRVPPDGSLLVIDDEDHPIRGAWCDPRPVLAVGSRGSRGLLAEKALRVVDIVAREYNYKRTEILGRSRHQPLAEARQVAAYLAQSATGISWSLLGITFGRDHGTMLHARNRVRELISIDRSFGDRITRLAGEAMRVTK